VLIKRCHVRAKELPEDEALFDKVYITEVPYFEGIAGVSDLESSNN
jgi:hypothetical protein